MGQQKGIVMNRFMENMHKVIYFNMKIYKLIDQNFSKSILSRFFSFKLNI